ncbi:GNAT family N-acetyltransferase [Corynebacterium aquatimens]|uniref:Ribosomal-protein-alanine N-acetyltransferase n=1 Tax=Corynebacterium aquatimens TaxID=1190508 RepID=A0A931GRK9_9CORY|nr:GNAT family protein [Corynebacterium aquatimens]MBG6121137.1 ribosomal-protein-alanine N-acetyltransferase [Corynebacterium aquatimens]WJY66308.1 Putative ribosomal N-acetyltransferase YdaF [Corynebacterium aquatimens]
MINFLGFLAPGFRSPASGQRHAIHPGWPESTPIVRLTSGERVQLRPLQLSDGGAWRYHRLHDEPTLRPVEPTVRGTWDEAHSAPAWRANWRSLRQLAHDGTVVPFVIEVDGRFAGQVTLGNIQHGAVSECWIGYWVISELYGRGVATAACALGTDHAFARVGMHRVTATYLPSNPASGSVLKNCGFREEGFLRRNLHIDGAWRDHHFVAQNRDDLPGSAVRRLEQARRLTVQ